jgi:hypothetical protein
MLDWFVSASQSSDELQTAVLVFAVQFDEAQLRVHDPVLMDAVLGINMALQATVPSFVGFTRGKNLDDDFGSVD